ncbi:MAG: hypothetical protein ACYC19_03725 [Acidimicrobiales bacterium]
MNEQLLKTMMEGIDPARDLTDETLNELLPHDRLMARLRVAIADEERERRGVRVPVWRRVSTLIAAGTAATAIAAAAAIALLGSAPAVIQGTALGPSASKHQAVEFGPLSTQSGLTLSATGTKTVSRVRNDRFLKTITLDGGAFSVSPAPASMKTPSNAAAVAREIWATSQLQGYSKWSSHRRSPSFGYGIVTLTRTEAGVQVITKEAAWVGLAHETATYYCPLETGAQSTTQLLHRAPSSGLAAVAVAEPSGTPAVVYVARTVRCGRLYPAVVTNATEQFSLSWRVVGGVGGSEVALDVTPPPCGHITGNAVSATTHSGSLSSVSIAEYGTAPDATVSYQSCPVAAPVREVINLGGPTTSTTRFIHATTGLMRIVTKRSK